MAEFQRLTLNTNVSEFESQKECQLFETNSREKLGYKYVMSQICMSCHKYVGHVTVRGLNPGAIDLWLMLHFSPATLCHFKELRLVW